ncbi:MAG TPA: SurA N-terminal domain-containing protein [Peptostreptococcaceae bacterium]|nr:SurA N-terminal domain-containing protein [Peptostreptococcaceae bacterium]
MMKLINKKGYLVPIILTVVLGITSVIYVYNVKSKDSMVGRVGNETITKDELYNYLVKENGQTALDSLVAEKIIDLEVKSKSINVTEEEIQKKLDELIEENGGEEMFEQSLQYYGYTMDDIKKNIKQELSINKLLQPNIKITEDEMKTYFEENKETFEEAKYEESKEKIKDILFEEKLSTEYSTWIEDKYTEYEVETSL